MFRFSCVVVMFTYAMLSWLLNTTCLFGKEVCFVNDSDRTVIFSVISGSDRFERRLKPGSHVFVTLQDSLDDRVVITQYSDESGSNEKADRIKVIRTKVLSGIIEERWKICYVHGGGREPIQMDLLGFICLDIVALQWHEDPSDDRYPAIKTQLFKSLFRTTEIDSLLAPKSFRESLLPYVQREGR